MRCHIKRFTTCCVSALLLFMFVNTLLDLMRAHTLDQRILPVEHPNRRAQFLPPPLSPRVWPRGRYETDDRIPAQLARLPPAGNATKLVLSYYGVNMRRDGGAAFRDCPVSACTLSSDVRLGPKADAVLWQQTITLPTWKKPVKQVWIMYMLESPENTAQLHQFRGLVNWTATYRRDSTLVTPYERFTLLPAGKRLPVPQGGTDYAANKTRKVAWFVSNCSTRNGRMAYVEELQKHIDVDIYGSCGPHKCPRHTEKCFQSLKQDYKFYLAFENSNCQDYITEKLYWNAYLNNIIPVVMGARPQDYALACPPHSYIHVDDFDSPKALAAYLHKLDKDDALYNRYFEWKGSGHFIDTQFWCRLCAMLHDETQNAWYDDINDWWRGGATCVKPRGDRKWATWRDSMEPKHRSVEPLKYGPRDQSDGYVPNKRGLKGRKKATATGLDKAPDFETFSLKLQSHNANSQKSLFMNHGKQPTGKR